MKFSTKSILGSLLLLLLPLTAMSEPKWEQIRDDPNMKIWRGTIEGSPLTAFKGTRVMNVKITKVVEVLLSEDVALRKGWVDRLSQFSILEKRGQDDWTFYAGYDMPWPIEDRDYVIDGKMKIDGSKNEVLISMKSAQHSSAPKTIGVRADLTESWYRLVPLPGDKTEVTVSIQTNPRGELPPWLVNLIQKSWPANTLSKLESVSSAPGVKEHEGVKARLDGNKLAVGP
jgi:hypothetical protein